MTYEHFRSANKFNCLICNAPLPFQPVRKSKLCGQAACHQRYSRLQQQNKLCKICGRPLSTVEQLFGVCVAPECRRAAIVDRARQERERREQRSEVLREQAAQLRDQAADDFGIRGAESFQLAVIPASVSRITRLPAQRRREFRNYMKDLIGRSFAIPITPTVEQNQATPPIAEETRLQAASGQACACCRGSCCQGGGYSHAYLEIATLQRYRATHPDQSPREVLNTYMSHVGKETNQGSCVYHGADGCGLTRDMRADICNEFYCAGLQEFRQSVPPTGSVRGFFVAATEETIQRAALVHEDQSLMVPVSPEDSD